MTKTDDCLKLYDAYHKGEIERRAFIRGIVTIGGVYLIAEIILSPADAYLKAIINGAFEPRMQPTQEMERPPYNVELVRQLFGEFQQQHTKFTPGFLHYLFPREVPPDDLAAMATVDQICRSVTAHLEIVDGFFLSKNFSGTFVCTGSPMSNLLSRLVMQYEDSRYESYRGLIREREPVLDLRYEYVFDPRDLSRSAPHRERVGRGQVLNWSVRDVIKDEMFWPQVRENTFLSTDYLLVTVAPNLLDRESFEKGEKIIIFGGTHGPGTRAVETLFSNESILRRLLEQVRGIQYWQALLQVDQISHKNDVDKPFSLSQDIRSCPINISDAALRKWFEQLRV